MEVKPLAQPFQMFVNACAGGVSNVQKVFPFVSQSPQQQPQQQLQQPHNNQVQHNQSAEEKSVKVKVAEQTNHYVSLCKYH
jgi:hypothetical protein